MTESRELGFTIRSNGIFVDEYTSKDGLPVRDTFAYRLKASLFGDAAKNLPKNETASLVRTFTAPELEQLSAMLERRQPERVDPAAKESAERLLRNTLWNLSDEAPVDSDRDPHAAFIRHIELGKEIWRDDRRNGEQGWISQTTLGGDAKAIRRYGYLDLCIPSDDGFFRKEQGITTAASHIQPGDLLILGFAFDAPPFKVDRVRRATDCVVSIVMGDGYVIDLNDLDHVCIAPAAIVQMARNASDLYEEQSTESIGTPAP